MSYHHLPAFTPPKELIGSGGGSMVKPLSMIDLYCRACKRSVEFRRTDFPDVPSWVARIEHDKCNLCDDGGFSAEHWLTEDGLEPDPDTMPKANDPLSPSDDPGGERGEM